MAKVTLNQISKRFQKTDVLHSVTAEMETNALTVLVGPSGCGKSTLLRLIAGLEEPTSGDIYIAGRRVNDVAPFHRGIAMVFQSYALYPHMTVYENMQFGLTSLRIPKEESKRRILEAAEILGLTPYLQRKPKQLSGGQRQRVAMGRALVRKPEVFLFDEPLSNLDAALRTKMRIEIARLRRAMRATAIYVTHDQVEAMTLADKIIVLRAGKIEQVGTPLDVYHTPCNRFVAGFLGSPAMNFIPTNWHSVQSDCGRLGLPGGATFSFRGTLGALDGELASSMEIGVRPENVLVNPKESDSAAVRVSGRVFAVEKLGDQTLVHAQLPALDDKPSAIVVARVSGSQCLNVSDTVELGLLPEQCHLFAGESASYHSQLGA